MKRILVTYRSTHEAYFLFEKIRDLLKSREDSQIVTYINSGLNSMEITNYKAGWKIKFVMDDFSKLRGTRPDYFYTSNSDVRSYLAKVKNSTELDNLDQIVSLVNSIHLREDYIRSYADAKFNKPVNNFAIEKVIFNDPATIVIWKDGSKTIVKCQDGDTFDAEKGLALAIAKKVLGTNKSKSNFNDVFKKWIKD